VCDNPDHRSGRAMRRALSWRGLWNQVRSEIGSESPARLSQARPIAPRGEFIRRMHIVARPPQPGQQHLGPPRRPLHPTKIRTTRRPPSPKRILGVPKPRDNAACQRGQCGPYASPVGARCPITSIRTTTPSGAAPPDHPLDLRPNAAAKCLRRIPSIDH
jgi:hypothetical protein